MPVEQILSSQAAERRPAGGQLVSAHPEAVNVRPAVERLASNLLRRHIRARSLRLGLPFEQATEKTLLLRAPGEGEVDDAHLAGVVAKDVVRLEIAMHP